MAISRGTSTDYKDLLTKLNSYMTEDKVATAAVSAAGTGYVVGDILTILGGTTTHAGQVKVTTIGGSGDITGVRIWDSGQYTVNPSLTGNAATGGTGASATFDLTMETSNWTKILDDSTLDTSTQRVVLWKETVTDTFIGVRTYSEPDGLKTCYAWMLLGMSSFNSGLGWWQQPDINPAGFNISDGTIDLTPTLGLSAMVLKDSDGTAMDYWFFVTGRRVMVVTKLVDLVTTTPRYMSCHMGQLNPFGTSVEFPYPLYIAGSTSEINSAWDASVPAFQFSGLTRAIGSTSSGPGMYFSNDGTWDRICNQTYPKSSNTSGPLEDGVVYPCGNTTTQAQPVPVNTVWDAQAATAQWEAMILMSGVFTGIPAITLKPTPDSGGARRLLVPTMILISRGSDDKVELAGEIDGLFWANAGGATPPITPEDTITDTGTVYRGFNNGANTNADAYQFFRED